MKREKFDKSVRLLAVCFAVISVAVPVVVWVLTENWRFGVVVLAGNLALCLLAYFLHRLDDIYITEVVADLSDMVEMLIELKEREIFPEGEDMVLSKLQTKLVKLVRILKHKNELAEQEHENIKELVSDISHQLKTPISNLKMYSHFLEEDSLPEEKRREYVGVLCMSVERLHFLTENMIKISRLESGLIQLSMQEQSLNETVLMAVKDIYPRAKQRQVEIVYQEEQLAIGHDRNWTAEAVFNLLDNAVKYAEAGSRVVLSIRRLGMFAEVAVEDENGAIPEEEHTKIFQRFYRGKNSRKQEGIGVGLYLTREIVVKQGGYMRLKTTDKGNIFSMVLYVAVREGG